MGSRNKPPAAFEMTEPLVDIDVDAMLEGWRLSKLCGSRKWTATRAWGGRSIALAADSFVDLLDAVNEVGAKDE
jgi:hypothetical protein